MKSNLRNEIKSYIVRQGMTMQEVVDLLRDEHGWSDSVSNLSNKLQRESLRYVEAVQLADCTGGLSDAEAAAARLNPLGGLRETGGLPLFSPEGRTYSPPVKQAVVCLRHRALSEEDCGYCGSRQTMPQHLRALLSSSARLD